MNEQSSGDLGQEILNEILLARWCSLCGQGCYPTSAITIGDEPDDGEYRWSHNQCKVDHDRAFLEAFGAENHGLGDYPGGESA